LRAAIDDALWHVEAAGNSPCDRHPEELTFGNSFTNGRGAFPYAIQPFESGTTMGKPLVGIVIGSRADFNIMRRGMEMLRVMGVPYIFEMASPFRTPNRVIDFAQGAAEAGLEVLICGSGGAATIAGILASHTILPVIAVPLDVTPLRGQDALYSMAQTPPGVPVATVGINNSENAALLAATILAIKYPKFKAVILNQRRILAQRLDSSRKELLSEYADLCSPARTAPDHTASNVKSPDDDTDPGTEDVTPEPPPTETNERIRPGAVLPQGSRMRHSAGSLLQTPEPQEPGSVTEDHSLYEPHPNDRPANAAHDPALPPPPALNELAPPPQQLRMGLPPPAIAVPTPLALPREPRLEAPPITVLAAPPVFLAPPTSALAAPSSVFPGDAKPRALETKIFRVNHEAPDEDVLSHAMMVLLEGGIVALPTDTVYGLAVDATNPDAVRRLYEVKGHEAQRKSLSVLIHASEMLDTLVKEVPPALESVLEQYWPGGLTILFYKHPTILQSVSESPSIAIRIPNNRVALSIMGMVQRPLAVINASYQDAQAATDAKQVMERFSGRVHCVLDGGTCRSAETSTVMSVLTEPFEILREGAVPRRELKRILGSRLRD